VTHWGQRVVETVLSEQTLEDALLDLSNRGDIVADPFLGSGSTLIAAEKTGRICRGVGWSRSMSILSCADTRLRQATLRFSSRQERRSTYWPGVGQGKQRRSRVGSRGALGSINPWKRRRRHRTGACSVEVRGSNPLSSTTQSGQTAVVSGIEETSSADEVW
jgi:hypothetical protein